MDGDRPELPARKSTRLHGFNYSTPGAYFLTICCDQMKSLFGVLRGTAVVLNAYGKIAQAALADIQLHQNATVDSLIVMPNHVHAIVFLDPWRFRETLDRAGEPWLAPTKDTRPVPTISAVVGLYKQAVTRAIRRQAGNAQLRVWQRGYFEHIIRDEDDLRTRRQYMLDNPQRWALKDNRPP